MPTHNTKWYSTAMAAAPSLTGEAGKLTNILNACLVDGFNQVTLTSLVVASNVATATYTAHGFLQYQIIEIAGATPSSLNGTWRVATSAANTFTFSTSGISDQTATGTITCKTPGAGWEKAFTGTNTVVYRPLSAYASGNHAVRVTDTGTTTATCLAAEDWTDVSTPVNSIDTIYVPKSSTANTTVRNWYVVADDRTLYIATAWSGGQYDVVTWGEVQSFLAGDGHAFHSRAPRAASVSSLGYQTTLGHCTPVQGYTTTYGYLARPYSQTLGAIPTALTSMAGGLHELQLDITATGYGDGTATKAFKLSGAYGYSASSGSITYSGYKFLGPSPVDGGIHFVPVYLVENLLSGSLKIRGVVRGLLHVVEWAPFSATVAILPSVDGVTGGLVLGFKTQNEIYGYTAGQRLYPETHIAISLGDWS